MSLLSCRSFHHSLNFPELLSSVTSPVSAIMSLHSGHRNASLDATKIADAPERDLEKSPEEDQTSGVAKKPDYPTGLNLFLILFCLCATVFLVALDATIIANAIPVITSKFNSLGDIAVRRFSMFLNLLSQIPSEGL